jgi:hypothetical protein
LPQDLTQRNITPTAAGGGVALSVVPRLDFTKLAAGIGASNVYPLKYQSKDSSTNPFIGRNNKQQNTDEDDHEDSDKSIKAKKKASQRQQRLKNFLMRK